MRIVTFTDSHLRELKPIGRTELDWVQVCVGQLEAVVNFALEQEADAILCSGDMFDRPNNTPRLMVAVMDAIKPFTKDGKPFVVTPGQHDVYGHRVTEWKNTYLGILETAGMVTVLTTGKELWLSDSVAVHGFSFGETVTEELLRGVWRPDRVKREVFRIGLVHASVGAEETMGWAGISNQNIKGLQVVQTGDIHDGYGFHYFNENTKEECCAFNPGSLVRTSRSDIGRDPAIAVIEIDEGDLSYEIKSFVLPDGDDEVCWHENFALGPDALPQSAEATEFTGVLRDARNYRNESPLVKLNRVGNTNSYTPRQISLAVDRCEDY